MSATKQPDGNTERARERRKEREQNARTEKDSRDRLAAEAKKRAFAEKYMVQHLHEYGNKWKATTVEHVQMLLEDNSEALNQQKLGYLPIFYAVEAGAKPEGLEFMYETMIEKHGHPPDIKTNLVFSGPNKVWKCRSKHDIADRIEKDNTFLTKNLPHMPFPPTVYLVKTGTKVEILEFAFAEDVRLHHARMRKWIDPGTGNSMLHIATIENQAHLIPFLLCQWPFAAALKNRDGETPWDIARRMIHTESKNVLRAIRGAPKQPLPRAFPVTMSPAAKERYDVNHPKVEPKKEKKKKTVRKSSNAGRDNGSTYS